MLQSQPPPEEPVTFGDYIQPLVERLKAHQRWVEEVRDPAGKAKQEVEKLEVQGAVAERAVARIAEDRWAVKWRCAYTCGNYFGASSPWEEKGSREECVREFEEAVGRHFGPELDPRVSDRQKGARRLMLALFREADDQLLLF